MTSVPRNQAGITLGLLFALMHTGWLALVATGLAGPVMNAIEQAHFLSLQHTVLTPTLPTVIAGIIGAFITGYIFGAAFAFLWNMAGKKL